MKTSIKLKIFGIFFVVILIVIGSVYWKYFGTAERKNITMRKVENLQGLKMTVHVFSYSGRILRTYENVSKITSGKGDRSYTYFRTSDNRYVQIPNSVCYIAEDNFIEGDKKKETSK